MAKLKVPSLQHMARNWRNTPDAVRRRLVMIAKQPPRFSYELLFAAVRDMLVLGVPYEQAADSIRRIEKRPWVRKILLEVLPIVAEHFDAMQPDNPPRRVAPRYYPLARDILIPFEAPLEYSIGGQVHFPWFSFWRSNPIADVNLSLFVMVVEEVLLQDPAWIGPNFAFSTSAYPKGRANVGCASFGRERFPGSMNARSAPCSRCLPTVTVSPVTSLRGRHPPAMTATRRGGLTPTKAICSVPMAVPQTSAHATIKPHLHIQGEKCPWCEQPIPNEKLEEVHRRIAAKERQRQVEVDARTRAEVEAVRKQGLAALAEAKVDGAAREAEALEHGKQQARVEMEAKVTEATDAARAAADREAALATQLAEAHLDRERAACEAQVKLEAVQVDAASREAEALKRGQRTAETAFKEKLHQAAEHAAAAAEREAHLEAQLTETTQAHADAVQRMTAEAAAREEAARAAGITEAQAALAEKMAAADTARHSAETRLAEAEAGHEAALNAMLQEQREALEKHSEAVLNAERAKGFEEKPGNLAPGPAAPAPEKDGGGVG